MSNQERREEREPIQVRLHLASGTELDTVIWTGADADEDEVLDLIRSELTDPGLYQGHGWVHVGAVLVHTKALCAVEIL